MTITDWIQAFSSVVALIISTFAVVQTYKIQKDSSKPYINVYFEFIDTVTASKYISIKNFGKSPASITYLSFSKKLNSENADTQMHNIIGTTLAPNQKVMIFIENSHNEKLTATIHYTDQSNHKYSETFPLNLNVDDFIWTTENLTSMDGESSEAKAIRTATHAILKKLQ